LLEFKENFDEIKKRAKSFKQGKSVSKINFQNYLRYIKYNPLKKVEKKISILNSFFQKYGYCFCSFILLANAIYKKNLYSLPFTLLSFFFFYKSDLVLNLTKFNPKSVQQIQWTWRIAYDLILLLFVRNFFVWLAFPTNWDIRPFQYENDFSCPKEAIYFGDSEKWKDPDYFKCLEASRRWY
jgi:hypothetical protein